MEKSTTKKKSQTNETDTSVLEKLRKSAHSEASTGIPRGTNYYKQIVDIPNKTERILSVLVDLISETGLQEGDRLPPEKELCDLFGVGTRSLREALIGLRTLGLVQSQQGTGWYVKEFKPAASLKLLSRVIQNFSHADLNQIMNTRLANEPVIAAMAAENISESGIAELQDALTVMKETSSDVDFRFHDRKFHDILAQECGNDIMAMISSMLTGLFYVGQLLPKTGDHLRIIHQHQAIYAAIETRDSEQAEEAMRTHLQAAWEFVNRLIKEDRIEPRGKVRPPLQDYARSNPLSDI
jgi:GntR family transcriptional repressor for pyruvate dehydrogenase complex